MFEGMLPGQMPLGAACLNGMESEHLNVNDVLGFDCERAVEVWAVLCNISVTQSG